MDGVATEKVQISIEEIDSRPGKWEERYKKAADEAKARTGKDLEVRGGEFVDIDGIPFVNRTDLERYNQLVEESGGKLIRGDTDYLVNYVPSSKDQNLPLEGGLYRDQQIGKYGVNNGVLEYVDEHGRKHLGFATEENQRALEEVGYQQDTSFSVDYTGGDIVFVNPRNELTGDDYSGFSSDEIQRKVNGINEKFQTIYQKNLDEATKKFDATNQTS